MRALVLPAGVNRIASSGAPGCLVAHALIMRRIRRGRLAWMRNASRRASGKGCAAKAAGDRSDGRLDGRIVCVIGMAAASVPARFAGIVACAVVRRRRAAAVEGDELDAFGQCADAQHLAKASLSDEIHQRDQIHAQNTRAGQRRQPERGQAFGEHAADEPQVVQDVDDAAEKPVDEHGVYAPVARSLRALSHHQRDAAAVKGIHRAREQDRESFAQKREQHERRDDEGEKEPIHHDHVNAQVLLPPYEQQRQRCAECACHRHDVHQAPDGGFVDGERPHDAAGESERPDAQRASPVVFQHAPVDGGVFARNVFEHGLRRFHGAAAQDDAQSEQRKENKRNEQCRDGAGDKIEREVKRRRVDGSHHQVVRARFAIASCENALPQHVESGRPQSKQRAADGHEGKRRRVDVHGADQAGPSEKVRNARREHKETACRPRHAVRPCGACQIADAEYERLSHEEMRHGDRRLHGQGQKRKDAAPYARCIDGKKKRVAKRAYIGFDERACLHEALLPSATRAVLSRRNAVPLSHSVACRQPGLLRRCSLRYASELGVHKVHTFYVTCRKARDVRFRYGRGRRRATGDASSYRSGKGRAGRRRTRAALRNVRGSRARMMRRAHRSPSKEGSGSGP